MPHHCIYIFKILIIEEMEKTKNGEDPNSPHYMFVTSIILEIESNELKRGLK
jgi:hypothetical protein